MAATAVAATGLAATGWGTAAGVAVAAEAAFCLACSISPGVSAIKAMVFPTGAASPAGVIIVARYPS